MAGFQKGDLKKITAAMLQNIQDNKSGIENTSTEILQNVIKQLDVFDTGNLRRHSRAKVFTHSQGATIRLMTDGQDVPYWKYPFFGWSTSRDKGPRKWTHVAAPKITRELNIE
jgi:hypothetical protein